MKGFTDAPRDGRGATGLFGPLRKRFSWNTRRRGRGLYATTRVCGPGPHAIQGPRLQLGGPHLELLDCNQDHASTPPPRGLFSTCVSVNPPKLLISWLLLEQAKALLHRRGSAAFLRLQLRDHSLHGQGCSTSHPTDVTTPEAAPAGLRAPTLRAVSATQINASWAPPSMRSESVTEYLLRRDGQEHHAGQNLPLLVAHLQPYTQNHFYLVACRRGDCTSSVSTSAWMMEPPPSPRTWTLQTCRSQAQNQ